MNGTDSSTGALAGRFDLLGEIGSGSSGTVHRARTRKAYGGLPPGTEVAVKFLRQDRLSDPLARRRLLAEGRLGQRLRSPYVARIHGVETLELMGLETTYLVMELVEGTDLRELLDRSGPVVEDLARRIGMDAALGLEALHHLGVVHRDLKPENLAISPEGHVKLMDLGLATRISRDASRRSFAGSVIYAAPEVLRGGPATPRSDLYSLGVVLFEVATGRHPFAHHQSVDDLLHAHLQEAPPRASHVRPRVSTLLEAVIEDLMAKDARMRPASGRELANTLQLGERSPYWRERERRVPVLASRRRLNRMRRPAPTSFVGRATELRLLEQAISAAATGHGAALRIQGTEGVGRRRLLDEALSRMLTEPDAAWLLVGEAVPGLSEGQGMPFSRMLLEWCLRGDQPDSPKALDRVAIRLQREGRMAAEDAAKLAAILTGESRDDPPEVRADLLARGFLQLSTVHPLVLRVDRADQLGTTGTLVLERLVQEAPGQSLLMLTVSGSAEDDAGFDGKRLTLAAMPSTEFAALGRSLFRSGAVEQEFLEAAHRTLAGNPGNLMDALSHLMDHGKLEGQPGDFHGLRVAAASPAPPLLSRLSARTRSLPVNDRRILHGAAVLGERFRITELASLTMESELRVLEALSTLQGGVIRAVQGRGRFLHRDYRRALLRGVPNRERRSLHRAAARITASRGASPLEVGLHLSRAGEHQECLAPLLEALEQLVRRRSRRSSARLLARIRVHLEAAPDNRENRKRRLRFLLLAARVVPAADRGGRAMEYYRQASSSARELEDHVCLGEALTGMATLALESGQFLAAQSLLERTHLALERSEGGREVAARAFALHARVMAYLCQPDRGLHYLRKALRILPPREVGQLTHILVDRARLERMGYHFDTALVTLNRAERLLRHHPSPIAELRVRLYRGQILAELNDKHAVSQLREASEEAQRLSNPRIQAKALLLLGDHQLGRGNRGIATELLRDAAQLGHWAQDRLTASHALVLLGELGTPTPGLEETVHDLGTPSLKVAWLLGEARRHGMAGRPEMVRVCADEAMDIVGVVNLPLLLHLRVLQLSGANDEVRDLVQEVASHLPAGISRHRFHAGVDRLTGETHS